MKSTFLLLFATTLSIWPAYAGSRSSANYSIPTETIDSAGVNAQSADYALHGIAVGEFGVGSNALTASAAYIFRNGYVGQLYDLIAPTNIVSRKMHGPGGPTFDIPLPLIGPGIGIECRSGGTSNDYQVVFTFPSAITFSSAAVTPGTGGSAVIAGPPTINPAGTEVTVNLTTVSNAQRITITLFDVNDGSTTVDVTAEMGLLLGDTTGNGTVNASDIGQTKSQSGQPATNDNFRSDVTANGLINASDIGLIKSKSGTILP